MEHLCASEFGKEETLGAPGGIPGGHRAAWLRRALDAGRRSAACPLREPQPLGLAQCCPHPGEPLGGSVGAHSPAGCVCPGPVLHGACGAR